jgi:hypothetical protein
LDLSVGGGLLSVQNSLWHISPVLLLLLLLMLLLMLPFAAAAAQ